MAWPEERIPEADENSGEIRNDEELDMEGYSRFCRKYMSMEYRKLVDFFIERFTIAGDLRVLEIGPGPGWVGIMLKERLPEVEIVGLELSADMIEVARRNVSASGLQGITYRQGDAGKMPFPDHSFGGVISNGSMHHWMDPVKVFSEIERVLVPGGLYAVSDGRRDIGTGGKLFYQLFSCLPLLDPTVPGRQMRRGWKTSIMAGYTPPELVDILDSSGIRPWEMRQDFLSLMVHS